MQIIPINFN